MAGSKGNKNALKHGLYAKHYSEQQKRDLQNTPPLEAFDEINMLRATIDRLLKLIDQCDDEDRRVKLYNALYTGTQRLLAAMRTHTILVGDNQELLTSFWEAVAMFRKDKGIQDVTKPDEPPSKTRVPHPRGT
jgi:hypothetical protein